MKTGQERKGEWKEVSQKERQTGSCGVPQATVKEQVKYSTYK